VSVILSLSDKTTHTSSSLQVHLPGQHLVRFDPDEDPAKILERASRETTTLTAFFAANADEQFGQLARRYTYQEFPQHFVYSTQTKKWAPRQRGYAIGRMYFVSPTAGERFYLRTLLSIVAGPRSFVDLRTHNGVTYATFREACLARGLLEDDGEWRQCLEEAAFMQTGSQLRQLFAMLLVFCQPARPEELWAQYATSICDDLRRRLMRQSIADPTNDMVLDYGLFLLNELLLEYGMSLENFGSMPRPTRNWRTLTKNPFVAEQLVYDAPSEMAQAREREPLLNQDQRIAYDRITSSTLEESNNIFFLHGPGGTGKTFVYQTVCHRIRGEGHIVLCVASSGIASLLLPGGRTAHSTFKIPVESLHEQSMCGILKETRYADMLRQVRLLIWDEAGNQSRFAPEAVDRTLRDIRNDDRPFGGMTVVFGGDFQQTLPVVPKGSREEIVSHCLQRSPLWPIINVLHLRQNMRLSRDALSQEYARWLLDVGQGTTGERVTIPLDVQTPNLNTLIESVYSAVGLDKPVPEPDYFLNRMILSARNDDVDDVNTRILKVFPGPEEIYCSADSVEQEPGADQDPTHQYPVEYLRTLKPAGIPPGELRLKVGAPLLLLRNLAPRHGLCNGTRMVLLEMGDRVLRVRIIGGEHDGDIAFIPRISLTPSNNNGQYAFRLKRRQFPVRLAFGMSINKAQGQSVKVVGLDLRTEVFAHGQLYVALSRATSRQHVKILLPNDAGGRTKNIVYPEVLLKVRYLLFVYRFGL
jgi:hypothetical protein